MGSKPSNALKAKRPESGGTIEMDMQEQSRLMDADKAEFAQSQTSLGPYLNDGLCSGLLVRCRHDS